MKHSILKYTTVGNQGFTTNQKNLYFGYPQMGAAMNSSFNPKSDNDGFNTYQNGNPDFDYTSGRVKETSPGVFLTRREGMMPSLAYSQQASNYSRDRGYHQSEYAYDEEGNALDKRTGEKIWGGGMPITYAGGNADGKEEVAVVSKRGNGVGAKYREGVMETLRKNGYSEDDANAMANQMTTDFLQRYNKASNDNWWQRGSRQVEDATFGNVARGFQWAQEKAMRGAMNLTPLKYSTSAQDYLIDKANKAMSYVSPSAQMNKYEYERSHPGESITPYEAQGLYNTDDPSTYRYLSPGMGFATDAAAYSTLGSFANGTTAGSTMEVTPHNYRTVNVKGGTRTRTTRTPVELTEADLKGASFMAKAEHVPGEIIGAKPKTTTYNQRAYSYGRYYPKPSQRFSVEIPGTEVNGAGAGAFTGAVVHLPDWNNSQGGESPKLVEKPGTLSHPVRDELNVTDKSTTIDGVRYDLTNRDDIGKLLERLNRDGAGLKVDNVYGQKTLQALRNHIYNISEGAGVIGENDWRLEHGYDTMEVNPGGDQSTHNGGHINPHGRPQTHARSNSRVNNRGHIVQASARGRRRRRHQNGGVLFPVFN